MKKILLIEDDTQVCSFINKGLSEQNFEVSIAMDGEAGLNIFKTSAFDLIILDIMLPVMNGLEVCRRIRVENKDIPILMLTAMGSAENVVLGLESGADDYLSKPFKYIELLARIKTLLRRTNIKENATQSDDYIYEFADLVLNDKKKTLIRNGSEVSLTSTEYRLMLMFMKSPTKVLSRTDMLDEVWGITFDNSTNVVDVYVNYLRKKLDRYGKEKLIHTVFGMGYVLKKSNENP